MKIVILDGYTTNPGDLSWTWLSQFGEYEVYESCTETEIPERAADCEIVITNKTVLSADILSKLPKLQFIPLLSTGYNVVDCAYAKKRGIPVSNIPAYSTKAVAQQTFALILEYTNQVSNHSSSVKQGDWVKHNRFCYWNTPLLELSGKTIGIIGYGSIGREVAKIARAFSMHVVVHTPHPPAEIQDGIRFADLDELLSISDFVTVHCPLTEKTTNMVNADFLSKMKASAYFVNTSRGGVVDEQALSNALKNHQIAGAGIDVMLHEPPKDDLLTGCENIFITPHISWAGFETRKRLMRICEENIRAFVNGTPQNVVNP